MGERLPHRVERDAEKDRFEYQGYVIPMREAPAVFERAERSSAWAEQVLLTWVDWLVPAWALRPSGFR